MCILLLFGEFEISVHNETTNRRNKKEMIVYDPREKNGKREEKKCFFSYDFLLLLLANDGMHFFSLCLLKILKRKQVYTSLCFVFELAVCILDRSTKLFSQIDGILFLSF